GLARIVKAIRDDERTVLTVSTCVTGEEACSGACFSLPRVIGAGGVIATIQPALSQEEREALNHSAQILKNATTEIGY
ncbi:MAG TPA: L-lactate dehydrogenase, partial [bacterium]|nr:L-lactate dehydrogenase [bacterium]